MSMRVFGISHRYRKKPGVFEFTYEPYEQKEVKMKSPTDYDFYRHGSPYDRGAADSYYRRPRSPHYYEGRAYLSDRVGEEDMTPEEIQSYNEGYSDNEKIGNFKDYE